MPGLLRLSARGQAANRRNAPTAPFHAAATALHFPHQNQIKDPAKSLPFYEEVLGFKRLHEYKFDTFSLYFMYIPRPGEQVTGAVTVLSWAVLGCAVSSCLFGPNRAWH
jgi:hypothetical protein